MLQELRIVFMGTPEFAVASLNALLNAGCNIVGVVTAPDKPAGRGMKLTQSAVKQYAEEKGLHILQPVKLKDPVFIEELRTLKADVQVVVAFRMLPEVVWNMPPMGTINVHGSLLPQYRGAAPINWAVMNGEKETGVTTFRLQHAIDTGNILLREIIPIGPEETAGEVHDRMKEIGAALLVKTLEGIAAGSLEGIPQEQFDIPETEVRHAPKIFTETCKLDWDRSAKELHDQIRGLSPFPGAFTIFQEKTMKVYKSTYEVKPHTETPGNWSTDHKTWLRFATRDGYIYPLLLQPEGKKRMATEDFLRGFRG